LVRPERQVPGNRFGAVGQWQGTALTIDVHRAGIPEGLLNASHAASGLVLIGGVTGSGKSTSAVSLLDHINATRAVSVLTIEDPVVARLTPKQALIHQCEVGTDVPSTMAGIRHAFKMDPDVLFLGELKSLEELEAVVTAADMGHLVISVVHGATPWDILQRFSEVHPPETRTAFLRRFSHVLLAVSAQCLLRYAGGPGRVAAYGLVIPDDRIRQAIREGTDLAAMDHALPSDSLSLSAEIERLRDEAVVSSDAAEAALATLRA